MKSSKLFQIATKYIPGGVNSPVRAFRAVGGNPIFVKRGKGSRIWDEAGKEYVDFCGSWGALLFGHAPAGLVSEITKAARNGTSFGIATAKEVDLAQKLNGLYPSMEKVRLVSSGTEAVMSAIRLARGFTGRKKILKIDGGYHGHADSLLVKAGSGGATFGVPDSAGVIPELAQHTLTVPFNDIPALEKVFRKYSKEIAAFILEPVPANMGVVLPEPGYLEAARKITRKYDSLLIFDEVITGFRLTPGGAQCLFKIKPDLTTIGKILGSGLPIAAFGGRAEIMNQLAPLGPVYQAGTLSGNPVAVSAALWVFKQRATSHEPRATKFCDELQSLINRSGRPLQLNGIGSMFTLFFTETPVRDYASAKTADTKAFAKFFQTCLKQGIYLAPSQFEANFISTVHSTRDLDKTLEVFSKALKF